MSSRPIFGDVSLYRSMADALNSDAAWLEMAKPISYSMIYQYEPPVGKAFFVRFEEGRVTEVSEVVSGEEPAADFVITGKPDAWKGVVTKALNPTAAMATGKLKVRGKQTVLLRHMKAFSYLIDKMTTLDPVFP